MRTPDELNRNKLRRQYCIKPPSGESAKFKELWKMLVGDKPGGFYIRSDEPILTAYIRTYIKFLEVEEQLANENLVVTSGHGDKENPLLGASVKLAGVMLRLASALKLRPSCRTGAKDEQGTGYDDGDEDEADETINPVGRVLRIAGRRAA